MTRRPEVPDAARTEIDEAAREVREANEAGDLDAAEAAMARAWAAIPEPKTDWDFYPEVLSRTFADLLARADRADAAVGWLRQARVAYECPQVGDSVPLDRIDARIRLALGRRDEAAQILTALLITYGRRPFTGPDADLLPIARSGAAGGR